MRPLFEKLAKTGATLHVTTGAIAATAIKFQGFAIEASTGKLHVTDAGAGAVPATAIITQGLAMTPAGALYVRDAAYSSGPISQGIGIRSDGAMHINSGAAGSATFCGMSITGNRLHTTGFP